jgi:hypothetical protein
MKKIFEEGIIVSIIMVALISIIQILIFGKESYTMSWHDNMFKVGFILICLFPLIYYFFIGKKDKSESIALFLTSLILWFTGLPDVLYFWLSGKAIPFTLPWLNNSFVFSKLLDILNLTVVTNTLLLVSVAIGFVVVLLLDIWLEKVN